MIPTKDGFKFICRAVEFWLEMPNRYQDQADSDKAKASQQRTVLQERCFSLYTVKSQNDTKTSFARVPFFGKLTTAVRLILDSRLKSESNSGKPDSQDKSWKQT